MSKTAITVLLLFTFTLFGSETDYLEKRWHWEGIRIFTLRIQPEKSARFKDLDGYSNVDLADLYVQIPVIRKERFHIGLGGWYRQIYADLANFETGETLDYTTHVLRGSFASSFRFTPKHLVYGEYQMGIDGKWNNLTPEVINHRGAIFFAYIPGENRLFRLGVVYTRLYGKNSILPIVGTSFAVGKRSAFDFLFPSHMLYRIRVAPRVETGIRTFISSGDFGTENIEERPAVLSFTQLGSTLYSDITVLYIPEKKVYLRARLEGGLYYYRTTTLDKLDGTELLSARQKPAPMASFTFRWAL